MSLITRTDVTAVKFYKNYILAGIGSTINIFRKRTSTLLYKLQGLHGQKIYGFTPLNSGGKILVYGGKQFTVISTERISNCTESGLPEETFTRCFDPVICDDWIHSGVWSNDDEIALLTAHNVLQLWNTSTQCLISQNASKDNSILYSGLLLSLDDGVLVMAGTVFSEVIIHRSGDNMPLHRLKGHKGVIFSISCDPQQALIVTTSDDRSVRIWKSTTRPSYSYKTKDYWKNLNFACKHELYGHSARVMRSCITNNSIISVGEDSALCYWSYNGELLKKIVTHQNGCIWSVDTDERNVITGGGDCGIIIHPLAVYDGLTENINLNIGTVKKIIFTARNNLVMLNDNNDLVYYDFTTKRVSLFKLRHTSSYKVLTMSTCKQLIAVGDMDGKLDVFVENCKDEHELVNIIDTRLKIDKVYSIHWAGNRHLVICADDGHIMVLASKKYAVDFYASFELPYCKERWLTSCAIDLTSNTFILGDRCGNIHIYIKGKRDPVKTFRKVHGAYGATSIIIRNNEITTTGRDGTIKCFHNDINTFKYTGNRELHFKWVEKFLDKSKNLICGFQERVFVVYRIKDNCRVIEVPCGGGHRSWDAIRVINKINDEYDEIIKFIYLKNASIHLRTFQTSKIVSNNLINGSHAKEINCLKTYKCELDNSATFYFSGGEDTTLRISRVDSELKFEDDVIFKHLSSVRTLKFHNIHKNNFLLISAGGRAQINLRNINFCKTDKLLVESEDMISYQIKGTDKDRKGNQTWRTCTVDFDPETRVMDLDVLGVENELTVFCGCSDSKVRVFEYNNINSGIFKPIKELDYHKTCVLKTRCCIFFKWAILVTATTRGEIAFWNINDVKNNGQVHPFFTTKTNKSGINSLDLTTISDKEILLATAGDDNTIHLVLLEINDQNILISMQIKHRWSSDKYHSSQITGLRLIDNLLISTSIDQRITLFEWNVGNNMSCEFLSQTYSDIADIQGMDVLENLSDSIKVCVFGKGMEVVEIAKRK